MFICLLELGRDRFDMYAEPEEEQTEIPAQTDSWYRRWSHRASVRWNELVESSRAGDGQGWFERTRNRVVCHLAETLAEQRTLWALRRQSSVTLLFPSSMDEGRAREIRDRLLNDARRHHGIWLIVDTLLLLASAVLAPFPGPNAIAYYLAFRVVGHLQSWRGATRGLTTVHWTLTPDPRLAELASLVHVPHAQRASRLEAIAEQLKLPRLPAFFERVTV